MPTYYDESGNIIPSPPVTRQKIYYDNDGNPLTSPAGKGSGLSTAGWVAGGAGVAGLTAMAAKAARTPGGIIPKGAAFVGQLNALRQQAMLSGMALPKSIAGGVGATVANSLERKSIAPLKALFSGETVRDIGRGWTQGRKLGPAGDAIVDLPKYMDAPGRAMGAVDDAIQKSIVRSGESEKNATAALLQTPLSGGWEEAMRNPVMRYLFPFRRTPFNQFVEGGKALAAHPAISTGYGTAGAVQGATQADDQYPLTAGLGIAASGKYGLPQALGQIIGRIVAKGKGGGGIAGSVLPVSEYGLTQSVADPTRPFEKPAFMTLMEKLGLKARSR